MNSNKKALVNLTGAFLNIYVLKNYCLFLHSQ